MTLSEAVQTLIQRYPGRIPIGYWEQGSDFVINTKPISALKGLTEPSQFVVKNDGTVYGTNPARSNLDIADMKKI